MSEAGLATGRGIVASPCCLFADAGCAAMMLFPEGTGLEMLLMDVVDSSTRERSYELWVR